VKCVTILVAILSSGAFAQGRPDTFPAAAVAFLDKEIPRMEQAVAEKDPLYFQGAQQRVETFLEAWGLRSPQAVALERYPMCTDAVTDYIIVGLCKISPPGSLCEPSTFFPKFEANLQRCREIARANHAVNADARRRRFAPWWSPVTLVR
jgi:hypothetical protein